MRFNDLCVLMAVPLLAACAQQQDAPRVEQTGQEAVVDTMACETGPADACSVLLEHHQEQCDQANYRSCNALAVAHFEGAFAPEDKDKAMELIQRSCSAGDQSSCLNAGVFADLYAQGAGVPVDSAKATALNKTACAGGVRSACEWLEQTGRK